MVSSSRCLAPISTESPELDSGHRAGLRSAVYRREPGSPALPPAMQHILNARGHPIARGSTEGNQQDLEPRIPEQYRDQWCGHESCTIAARATPPIILIELDYRTPASEASPDPQDNNGSDHCAYESSAFARPVPADRLAEITGRYR